MRVAERFVVERQQLSLGLSKRSGRRTVGNVTARHERQLGFPASMAVKLKHLRYADAAGRHGSFRKAADSLSVKQSNLSRRIKYLEEMLGVQLFDRTSGGVRTTLAGTEFLYRVRRILEELQTVVDGARAIGRGDAGHITIGFYTPLSAGNLRSTLFDYSRRFPQVHVSAVQNERSCLCTGLQNGTIDIAIVTGEPAAKCRRAMGLWSERILIALPETHRLAAKGVLNWADLKGERFVLYSGDPGPEIEAILVAKLVTPGESLDIDYHDVNAESLKSLVSTGRGVTVVCESCLGSVPPGIVFRETRDGNGSTRVGFAPIGCQATTILRFAISFIFWKSATRRLQTGAARMTHPREPPIRRHETRDHRRDPLGGLDGLRAFKAKDLRLGDETAVSWSGRLH